jgi:lipoprotein-anchoring transpeptidase ErfK/SrfK
VSEKTAPPDPMLIKAQVLLDRADFSPGVIDGKPGTNFKHALAAYQAANNLPKSGDLDQATWAALTKDAKPVAATYTITPQDEAGPFAPDVGEDFVKLAALPDGPQFSDAAEMLAERFHMGENAMKALNPGVDFTKAGSVIVVAADPGAPDFTKGDVKRIEVSKAHAQVIAYGADHKVLAVYPATVGSREKPSPSGTHKVDGVAWNTDYTYNPAKLHWGPRSHGILHIKPGPNGPVGVVWIALNAPDYGIHGTPDPSKIGKTASHGCVRLTNWDATALAHGVKPGVVVDFVGTRGG